MQSDLILKTEDSYVLTGYNRNVKKILMIVLSNYPADPRVRREAEVLINKGHKVDVVCLRAPGESYRENINGVTAYRILDEKPKESIGKYILYTLQFMRKSGKIINSLYSENRYNLIQVHNMPDYLVFTTIRQKMKGIPVILDLHDVMSELFKSRWGRGIKRIFLPFIKILEKISWHYADALITTSKGFRQCLIKRGISKSKITLVYNTPDLNIFNSPKNKWTRNPEGPVLLYHGTVAERFGIHIALEAVKKLMRKYPAIEFNIYGNYQDSYKKRLINYINENNLDGRVSLHGYVSLEAIREIIKDSDFGIVPYLSDSFMDLALSTKTFEYVAMFLPVVASDIPSTRSVFSDDHLYYFRQGNADHLAKVLDNLINDGHLIEDKVQRAARAYQHMNWDRMSERYSNLIYLVSDKKKIVV